MLSSDSDYKVEERSKAFLGSAQIQSLHFPNEGVLIDASFVELFLAFSGQFGIFMQIPAYRGSKPFGFSG